MTDTDFVVYGYLRKDYGSFYYIGKGRPDRPHAKNKRVIPHPGCRSRVVILYENISEDLALENEKKLIALMGRIGIDEGGVLRNMSSGGEGVSKKHASELKQRRNFFREKKLAEMRRNWFHPCHGERYNLSPKELVKDYPGKGLNLYELNAVFKGKKYSHKGWSLLENRDFLHPRFDWYHYEHGVILQKTPRQLISTYSGLRLESLKRVINGRLRSHSGWELLKNVNTNLRKSSRNDVKNWYHKEHGTFLNLSYCSISKRFGANRSGLRKVSSGEKITWDGWRLLENKDLVFSNEVKLEDWEHEIHGVVENCSAGQLKEKFPDQGLITTMLRRVARGENMSHKGWYLKGKMVVKEIEPVGDWYNPDYGAFFGKTPREMAKVDKRDVVRPHMFLKLLDGRSKINRGWVALKKCKKTRN